MQPEKMTDRELGDVFEAFETLVYYGIEKVIDVPLFSSFVEDELANRELITDREVEWTEICTRERAASSLENDDDNALMEDF